MTKTFIASKLADTIAPYDLTDVLESLMQNGLVESWEWSYMDDEITITIPQDVEIKEVMAGFQELVEPTKKRSEH